MNVNQKILDFINENGMYNEEKQHTLNLDNRDMSVSGITMYLSEINQYPLLSLEEEKKYLDQLRLANDLSILKTQKIDIHSISFLDLSIIFSSLCEIENYQEILSLLLSFYQNRTNQYDKKILNSLRKYQDISNKIHRSLNKDELKEYFHIDEVHEDNLLSYTDLLDQLKKYFIYDNAYQKLFHSNLKLVVSIAKKYYKDNDLLPLINEGNIGLMKAIEKFDTSFDYKFSTYATYWIKEFILKEVYSNNGLINMPASLSSSFIKFKREVGVLEQRLGHKASRQDIIHELKIPAHTVDQFMNLNFQYYSYDSQFTPFGASMSDNKTVTLKDMIEDENIDIERDATNTFIKQDVAKLFCCLDEKEKKLIEMRFGFGKYDVPSSLKEISRELKISFERARRIEMVSLTKMRRLVKTDSSYKDLEGYINYH